MDIQLVVARMHGQHRIRRSHHKTSTPFLSLVRDTQHHKKMKIGLLSSILWLMVLYALCGETRGCCYYYKNPSTINISWNLSSTENISGYNISVTSNGKNAYYYTNESHHLLNLNSITNSSCDSINVNVSEDSQSKSLACDIKDIYIRSVPVRNYSFTLLIRNVSSQELIMRFKVSSLCVGELPSEASIMLFKNQSALVNLSGINPQFDIPTNQTAIGGPDYAYSAEVVFTNIAGIFPTATTSDLSFLTEFTMPPHNVTNSDACTFNASRTATTLIQVATTDPRTTTTMSTNFISSTILAPTPSGSDEKEKGSDQTILYLVIIVFIGAVIVILCLVATTVVSCVKCLKNRAYTGRRVRQFSTDSTNSFHFKPNKKAKVVLKKVEKVNSPSLAKVADSSMVNPSLKIKQQQKYSSFDKPLELKQQRASNTSQSVQEERVKSKVEEKKSDLSNLEMSFHFMDSYQEAIENRAGMNFIPSPADEASFSQNVTFDQPPPIPFRTVSAIIEHQLSPDDRAPSPPNETNRQPPPKPVRHLSARNNRYHPPLRKTLSSPNETYKQRPPSRPPPKPARVLSARNNYYHHPPAPKERAPSPPNEDLEQTHSIPNHHTLDVIKSDQYQTTENRSDEGLTDKSSHSVLREMTTFDDDARSDDTDLNVVTVTYTL